MKYEYIFEGWILEARINTKIHITKIKTYLLNYEQFKLALDEAR